MVRLPASTLARYRRFSCFNSPYPAHDRGCAIDLYPDSNAGRSPVAGEVIDTRTVRAPSRPDAVSHDHLILVDVDADCLVDGGDYVARILHVNPAVESGDRIAVGDSLGELVHSGFFAPWVDTHVHLGFRRPDQNASRAAGSLPVDVDVPVRPLPWDGTGRVVEVGETFVRLDAPTHPAPGEWVAIEGAPGVALDGGCPHYDGGGIFPEATGPVALADERVGVASGRTVRWDAVSLRANDAPLVGVSLFVARDAGFGAKLVCPGHDFSVGDRLSVTVAGSE